MPRFHWRILQEGQLPLRPDHYIMRVEHRPKITLLWRAGLDHLLWLSRGVSLPSLTRQPELLGGIEAVPCPGHAPDLRALAFRSIKDEGV
jgi:hypothetical protein